MVLRRRKGESLHDWFIRKRNDPYYQRQARRSAFLQDQKNTVMNYEHKLFGHKNSALIKVPGSKELGVDPFYVKTDRNGLVDATTGRRDETGLIHVRRTGQGSWNNGRRTDTGINTFIRVEDAAEALGARTPYMGKKASTGSRGG